MGTGIYVVETADDRLLGMVEFIEGGIIVRDGFVGRPHFVNGTELVSMTPAEDHPDVEEGSIPRSGSYFKVG